MNAQKRTLRTHIYVQKCILRCQFDKLLAAKQFFLHVLACQMDQDMLQFYCSQIRRTHVTQLRVCVCDFYLIHIIPRH